MTTRDIQGHLQDLYGVDVSAALISEVTDSVLEEVSLAGPAAGSVVPDCVSRRIDGEDAAGWQGRKSRVYIAIGINLEGQGSVLGLWANGNEGAKYWMAGAAKPERTAA